MTIIALLGAALALVVVAAWTHERQAHGAVLAVAELLADPSPQRRLQALRRVERDGVCLHAATLWRTACRETHPEVREALAVVVRRTSWEPTLDEDVLSLRRWAVDRPVGCDGPGAGTQRDQGDSAKRAWSQRGETAEEDGRQFDDEVLVGTPVLRAEAGWSEE